MVEIKFEGSTPQEVIKTVVAFVSAYMPNTEVRTSTEAAPVAEIGEEPKADNTEAPTSDPEVGEDFRLEVRSTLAKLNKKVGRNIANDLIKSFGVDKLTDVALADLPALMSKAKEVLDAA